MTHKCSDATSSLLTLSLLLLWYKCAGKGGGGAHEACQPGRDVADLVHAQSGQHQCHTATCRQEPESLLRGSHLFVDHAIYADSPTQQHICLLHVRCFKGNRHACCIAEKPVPLVIRILGLAPQMYHLQTHTLFSNCIAPPNVLHCALYPAQPSRTILYCSCNAMHCSAVQCDARSRAHACSNSAVVQLLRIMQYRSNVRGSPRLHAPWRRGISRQLQLCLLLHMRRTLPEYPAIQTSLSPCRKAGLKYSRGVQGLLTAHRTCISLDGRTPTVGPACKASSITRRSTHSQP